MNPLLPIDFLNSLNDISPCRELQLRQLSTIYNNTFPSPSRLVVYGLESTGKCRAVTSVLEARAISHALVKSSDCLSQRHFLSKTFAACVRALGKADSVDEYDRVDNLNTLAVNLEKLLQGRTDEKFVLILDGVDRQRGPGPTLLPALARLGDVIPSLSVIFISNSPRPLALHVSGVPYIYFPPYTRAEAIQLITASPPSLIPLNETSLVSTSDSLLPKWYSQFTGTVYDSLFAPTSSSLPFFRSACEKLWPRFIWPYVSGESPPGKAKTWDFARLLLRNRALFQTEGEVLLVRSLQPLMVPITFQEIADAAARSRAGADEAATRVGSVICEKTSTSRSQTLNTTKAATRATQTPLLKYFSTLVLTSAYLASHTARKLDILLFSRMSSGSKSHKIKKNYHRRKLFQSGSRSTPSKSARAAGEHHKTSKSSGKSSLDVRLGVAKPFGLERVTAILRAIHPQGVPHRKSIADKVYWHLAELERLRLVLSVGGGGGGDIGGDGADEERWMVNMSRTWVEDLAAKWGFGFREYEVGNG